MQGHNPGFHGQYYAMAQSSGTFYDHESPSGSDDDVGYLVYPDSHKMETSVDGEFRLNLLMTAFHHLFADDLNASLTSQTLNTDGTPKRPMNAFMIFARRRRPQVAAENQSMRTGDVSKVLSREWNGMSLVRASLIHVHGQSSDHDHSVRQTVLPRSSQATQRQFQS